jgi:hypothetical protein
MLQRIGTAGGRFKRRPWLKMGCCANDDDDEEEEEEEEDEEGEDCVKMSYKWTGRVCYELKNTASFGIIPDFTECK